MTDLDPLNTPNCPDCLHPMQVVEVGGVVVWDCDCGRDEHAPTT